MTPIFLIIKIRKIGIIFVLVFRWVEWGDGVKIAA